VKFKNYFSLITLAGIINLSNISYAAMPDAANVKEVHKDTTVGCTVCHPEGNFKNLNSYGKAYKDAGRDVDAVKSIDNADSDGDTITNADEIDAGTNPGDASSK